MQLIGIIDYMSISIGLFGRFLDILTTWIALFNPNNFEANPFYLHWIVNMVIGCIACLLPQLILLRWPANRRWSYWGSYFVALTMYVPVINNIGHII